MRPESEAMSNEVDKVLLRAPLLERALGRFLTALVLLYALWIMRPRSGIVSLFIAVGAIVAGWSKLKT
jgi:hypothetical protein